MTDKQVFITGNKQISPDFYELTFEWNPEWGIPIPGQFLELKVHSSTAPLLRRPFAFSDYHQRTEQGEIIYQKRGTSTELLSTKKVGDTIKIIAPIGTAFGVTGTAQKIIAVAGGVGLGPIRFVAEESALAHKEVQFVTGFRTAELVPDRSIFEDLKKHNISVTLCTNDGSEGFAGTVLDYLKTLSSEELAGATILACGPTPMLKAVHLFAQEKGLKCEVSMEELMACGIGACTGCVVALATGGYVRVCKEGPVFDSEVLLWN